ncbi:hypothetical protein GCM10010232_50180 [Streptomyces amakusaensis]|uniref:Uncharacterized protein n=1 Tax=Streptomyces amakusaensis TaxID=67271 RepID=A0ABW0AJZ6_9ACTN
MSRFDGEPTFFVLDYITITRDSRTRLVVAVGGDERAAGLLQTHGRFLLTPGPRGDYHRQPHDLPVEDQRQGATAAAHALLTAGFSVHLDPALNTLLPPDGDRQATHRYLGRLAEHASNATCDREVADILTEIIAPGEGLLPRLTSVLTATYDIWETRKHHSGEDTALADRLMTAAAGLRQHSWQIEQIPNRAAATPRPPLPSTAPAPPSPALPQPRAADPIPKGLPAPWETAPTNAAAMSRSTAGP